MVTKMLPFDLSALLTSDAHINEYLSQVFADGDSDEIVRALAHVAKARGIAQLATDSGLGRESLYKTLAVGSKPRFDTILRVCRGLGITLTPQCSS